MNILSFFRTYARQSLGDADAPFLHCVSSDMMSAIELWLDMAQGVAPWNAKSPPCGILKQISGRLNALIAREIGVTVANDAIRAPIEKLNGNVDVIVDYIALLGGCAVRPVLSSNRGALEYEIIPLGAYLPTKYGFDGELLGAALLKQIDDGGKRFLLAEEHEYAGGNHSVKTSLYRMDAGGGYGGLKRAALTDCEQTGAITPFYVWENAPRPMIIEFRNHALNKIDFSHVPVAIIAGAEGLIKDADEQYARMIWEQKAGEARVFADRDMFKRRQSRDGTTQSTELTGELARLITMIDGDGSAEGKRIVEHAPALRTAAQNEMLQQIFRRIELTCNLGKGVASDMESVQQTATQYTGGRQELYALVDKIEDEIEIKLKECARVFAHMAQAYGLGSNNADITITWNDDVTRKDQTQAKQIEMQEIAAGVRAKWEYRRDFFGENETDARLAVPEEPAARGLFDFGT